MIPIKLESSTAVDDWLSVACIECSQLKSWGFKELSGLISQFFSWKQMNCTIRMVSFIVGSLFRFYQSIKGRGLACQRPVIALLFISVFASLVFLTEKLGNFTTTTGHNDFTDDVSGISFVSDSRKLSALEQESGTILKEPVRVVYKDEIKPSAIVEDFTKGHIETRGQFELKESDGKNQGLINQQSAEVQPGHIALKLRDEAMESIASGTSKGEDQVKLEVWGRGRSQQRSEGESQKMRIYRQKNQKIAQDSRVRQMRDQLIRAKLYLNLTPVHNNAQIIRELRQRIREVQRALGEASRDADLHRRASERMRSMEHTLIKANQLHDNCPAKVKKLRAMVHSTEEQLRVQKKQSTYLTQLAARTLPKGLHCLPMRLTTEYYALTPSEQEFPNKEKLDDPSLYHHAIFSDNILATAVVVNSTVFHAKEPKKHVFHLVTDKLNYAAMRMWFLANPPGNATIGIQNIDEFTWLNSSYCPVLRQLQSASTKEFYFRTHHTSTDEGSSSLKYRNPKYLSMLNHLRFYLPEIFPKLDKVLFLDDDVVALKDLTTLWAIDLNGKVNGAVETCGETFHRFDKYLNFSNPLITRNFDPNSCGWAYGMNIFDLREWRKQDVTGIYHKWQHLNKDRQLWKLGSLPPGLITFYNLTYALDKSWHVLGLGYDPNVDRAEIERAAVIHYNGNMKPWLEIGFAKYKQYWTEYVKYDHIFLQQCNIRIAASLIEVVEHRWHLYCFVGGREIQQYGKFVYFDIAFFHVWRNGNILYV
eukprot:Gb_31230 [translate_table: standard]